MWLRKRKRKRGTEQDELIQADKHRYSPLLPHTNTHKHSPLTLTNIQTHTHTQSDIGTHTHKQSYTHTHIGTHTNIQSHIGTTHVKIPNTI